MIRKISITWLVLFPFMVSAQSLSQKIKSQFLTFSQSESLTYASFSFTVIDANTGNTVFTANPNTGLAPASTLKLITSATALQVLGANYRFKTNITYTGNIINHTLNGDVIITGHGDPTLGSWRWPKSNKNAVLNVILQSLVEAGIKNINGKIIADDSLWDTQSLPDGWLWQDMGNYYGAATSALCWGENQVELTVVPGKNVASAVSLKNVNTYPFLNIVNEVTTGNSNTGDNVFAYSAPYTNTIYLRGTYGINCKKQVGIAIPDPAYALAYDVQAFLVQNNIGVNQITTARALGSLYQNPAQAVTLCTITSPPLSEIIKPLNQKSINLYAEQLLRTLAAQKGKNATFSHGIAVVKNYAKSLNIASEALNMYDGSGLSPANRVSTWALARLLYQAQKAPWYSTFYQSLPSHNTMVMKSGSIADVLAYAGYHSNKEGKFCFSVVVNNYNGNESALRQKLFVLLNVLK
ncbi:MAG: D-alanyl-D-alanine carboxypeptidase/D-alanyl-D-alanine-endopeptidase [Sphingobacteriales bacterium]|nr:MAG: D-alanyl-D-alanine carboxypeptidase/D-alanyl-D-alanine-endopeptidase [Sphingobacteriales bacterium]TAF82557.1 MAG: D-alanyl-D-alanine carboxypeptidase/D-alanyl-D-alanine-endopeptidase [Sphingobacteriales bacterium]